MKVPLIGRDNDITALRALVAESPVVFVYGPAGVGKSALVLEALARGAAEEELPPIVHVSLEGVVEANEAIDRTARTLGAARPSRDMSDDDELFRLLTRVPASLVWDDLDLATSRSVAPLVARFAAQYGPSRVVLVARRFVSAKEVGLRAPVFAVRPLGEEAAVALVQALETARGRLLAADLAAATGGNPMMIHLALAGDVLAGTGIAGDPTEALRKAIEQRSKSASGVTLSLLAAADVPLTETEVARAAGKGASAAIDELRKHLIVVRHGPRISLGPAAAPLVREIVGAPSSSVWKTLGRIADRMLGSVPNDDVALLVAARARLELDDAAAALRVLKEHGIARASADPARLERLLRDVALRSAPDRVASLLLLVREQLRGADYEAARRTLDDLPRPRSQDEAERVALLRAECHVRAGEPAAAQRALDELLQPRKRRRGAPAPGAPGPALALTLAQLAILRGELEEARAIAERLAKATARTPRLEARRSVEIAASWLYEERYERTHEWVARARAVQHAAGIPVEPVATILDVHALLGLGRVDHAEEVMAREARGRPIGPMLEVALLTRRGEARRAIEVGDEALSALGRRADLLVRSVVARDLTRAALAIGDHARATRMLRLMRAGADEPGLAVLRPICDAEEARLAAARGQLTRALERIDRAREALPGSPFIAVDHAVQHGLPPALEASAPPIAHAYAALRGAEGAIAAGDLEAARDRAEVALQFYGEVGLQHEAARARLVLAEALARLHIRASSEAPAERGDGSGKKREKRSKLAGAEQERAERERDVGNARRAEQMLELCVAAALAQGYTPILVGAAVIRAALFESRGDIDAAASTIGDALRAMGDGADASLVQAARRFGARSAYTPRAAGEARGAVIAPMVERLGLSRPADVVWRIGADSYLRTLADPPPKPVVCVVEVDARRVRAEDGRLVTLPEQRVALLCALADAGSEGATLEELFARVWKGTFHPLRHRNAVYVALARLKESLKPFADDFAIAHDGERYRLTGAAPVGVRRRLDLGR